MAVGYYSWLITFLTSVFISRNYCLFPYMYTSALKLVLLELNTIGCILDQKCLSQIDWTLCSYVQAVPCCEVQKRHNKTIYELCG